MLVLLSACAPTTQAPVAPAATARASTAAATMAPAHAVDHAPSLDGVRGNWRVVAGDDPGDQAIMAISLLSADEAASANGDYVLFQPVCDVVDGQPVEGTSDCELIGQTGTFERIDLLGDRAVLAFSPTADGAEHRLELQLDGDALAGHYVAEGNDVRRAVRADRMPDD
ncbi:MAG: hypothetical protein KBI02_06075 [Thermomonas sp.]|nr:hypothetical protein [Thermomonas sp.]MBP8647955.1 hypothetical protein [Thermomonas sp.]